jgi:hypothetical protein
MATEVSSVAVCSRALRCLRSSSFLVSVRDEREARASRQGGRMMTVARFANVRCYAYT